MGVRPFMYWLTWYLWIFVDLSILATVFATSFVVPMLSKEAILKRTDPWIVYLFFYTFSFSLASFCILGSVLHPSAKSTTSITCLIYVSSIFVSRVFLPGMKMNYLLDMIISVSLHTGMSTMFHYEQLGVGIHSYNMFSSRYLKSMFFIHNIYLRLLSSFIYLLLAFLFYNIIIRNKPVWFKQSENHKQELSEDKFVNPNFHEDQTELSPSIKLEKISNSFMINVSMDMYENQVTALISNSGRLHLTDVFKGQVKVEQGRILVYGLDLNNDLKQIRKTTGICTKSITNLYRKLTVKENLSLFTKLKYYCQDAEMTKVEDIAAKFKLHKLLHIPLTDLKSSEIRMLQIALAFIGHNKVIILEEPFTNLEPGHCLRLCNIISSEKVDKTILLLVHSLEHVELTADVLAFFMAKHLICSGSANFLRVLLGAGYYLTITLEPQRRSDRVKQVVVTYIPETVILEEYENTVIFLLSLNQTENFYNLFSVLDTYKKELFIANYSIDAKTLDEAFSRLHKCGLQDTWETFKSDTSLSIPNQLTSVIQRDRMKSMCEILQTDGADAAAERAKGSPIDDEIVFVAGQDTEQEDRLAICKKLISKVKELNQQKLKGFPLLYAQAYAMLHIKMIFSTSNLVILTELIQWIFIFLLAFLSCEIEVHSTSYQEVEISSHTAAIFHPIITVTEGHSRSEKTKKLADIFVENFIMGQTHKLDRDFLLQYDIAKEPMYQILDNINLRNKQPHFGVEFLNIANLSAIAWYSGNADERLGKLPLSVVAVLNTFLTYLMGNQYSMKLKLLPIKRLDTIEAKNFQNHVYYDITHHSVLLMIIALSVIPYNLVLEREKGLKHQELIRGVSPALYWFTHFFYDYLNYIFFYNVYGSVVLFMKSEVMENSTGLLYILVLCSGLMMLPFIYVMQFLFNSPIMAATTILTCSYLTFLPNAVCNAIQNYRGDKFCSAVHNYCGSSYKVNYKDVCCTESCPGYFNCNMFVKRHFLSLWRPGVGMHIIAMIAHSCFWFLVLMAKEYRWPSRIMFRLRKYFPAEEPAQSNINWDLRHSVFLNLSEDSDIFASSKSTICVKWASPSNEYAAIKRPAPAMACFQLCLPEKNGTKVQNISLGVDEGDIFYIVSSDCSMSSSLLGTFAGTHAIKNGHIFRKGESIDIFSYEPFRSIGYCPQSSVCLSHMTAYELLYFFASIEGVRKENITPLVHQLISIFHLNDIAHLPAKTYSESKLERLNLAAALIGSPHILLVDNSRILKDTFGLNLVKNLLAALKAMNTTVVVTSSNMEESAALATRIALFVHGKLVCLAPPKEIQRSYTNSYTLLAKIDSLNFKVSNAILINSLKQRFPNAVVFHDQMDFVHMHIPYESDSLAEIFALMESTKKHLKIRDYTVHYTRLNHVMYVFEKAIEAAEESEKNE
ncbi:phospholipid-transporting ATPase ABCA3-like isoform X2 [Physella acuta]|uniref:phospholipid-transporting ATPase ABCA3-like isoform X2 n=1 Tax=Physella acuta TaxID=109671 RepID=UPI0027DC2E55|nr:phospholipid-transporting ATPase ABCA3-like isoform X2 [Physella acuta]